MTDQRRTYNTVTLWGAKYDACANCGTDELPRRWRGYCNRCSFYARMLANTDSWDPGDMRTWKGYTYSGGPGKSASPVQWESDFCSAAEYIAFVRDECRDALLLRKCIEAEVRGEEPVHPVSLEGAFIQMSKILATPIPRRCSADDFRDFDEATLRLAHTWLWDWLLEAKRSYHRRDIWTVVHERAVKAWRERTG